MIRVSSLSKKRKNYLVVFEDELGKAYDYLVSEDLVIEHRLVVDKQFEKKDFEKILSEIKKDEYYQKVLNYALFKPRTKYEIVKYLEKLSVSDFDYYIKKLAKLRLIDDDLYLNNYIDDSINLKRVGPNKIFNDLKTKGLNFQKIKENLKAIDGKVWLDNVTYWFEKKVKGLKSKSFLQSKKTIMNFLVNKGFDYEDILGVINNNQDIIKANIDEESAIKKEIEQIKKHYYKRQIKETLQHYIIGKLLAKGYQYKLIMKYIEGSNIDE